MNAVTRAAVALSALVYAASWAAADGDPQAAEATRPFVLARGRLADSYPEEVRESERRLTALVRDAIADAVAAGDGCRVSHAVLRPDLAVYLTPPLLPYRR